MKKKKDSILISLRVRKAALKDRILHLDLSIAKLRAQKAPLIKQSKELSIQINNRVKANSKKKKSK